MKLLPYKNLFIGIENILKNIFFDDKYADKEIERILKLNPKWGSKDRSFIAETVYELVRWRRLVEASMGKDLTSNTLWEFIGTWFVLHDEKLPDWEEFDRINKKEVLRRNNEVFENPAIAASVPDWLYELGKKELGEKWETELKALNIQASLVLRVNTLKTNRDTLQKLLISEGVKTRKLSKYPDALEVKEKTNVFRTLSFQDGLFEVQDAGSQLIAPYLGVAPKMRVIDACAGAGGKTLHLAALMKNKGQIIAMDLYDWKLKELKKRAKRNGVQNVQTKVIKSAKMLKRLESSADRLLIDAPCSGLGVLRRNPDAKWKLSPEFINSVRDTQKKILHDYCKMVKKGGQMVYATCSILPSENQLQIQEFLLNNPDFELVREKSLMPSQEGYDGFYMALLNRTK